MTLDEAILRLKQYQGYEPMFSDGEKLKHAFDLTDETVDTLLTALRPVSREQVEKVWRGEWIKLSAYRGMEQYKCSKCGQEIYVPEFMGEPIYSFCPMCSSAMMDSSVDLIIDKLGEMKFE